MILIKIFPVEWHITFCLGMCYNQVAVCDKMPGFGTGLRRNWMKKSVLILILIILAAAGAFAQSFSISAGAGGLFDWSFNNGVEEKISGDKYYEGLRNMSFGGFAFFDATYAEFDLSFTYGLIKAVIDEPGNSSSSDGGKMLQVGAGLLLKYPLDFGKITFFPLIGANYNVVLSYKISGISIGSSAIDVLKRWSQIGLLGGAGFDLSISGPLFLRIEALYQLRFASKGMKDSASGDAYATLGMGPLVKAGVGYRF